MNLIITTYKNKFKYFKNLKRDMNIKPISNIKIIENTDLITMERLIFYSNFSISCHSGFMVQIAGANKSKIIDIINKKDYLWYSCWKPKNTFHSFIFKSSINSKFSLNLILNKIENRIKNF